MNDPAAAVPFQDDSRQTIEQQRRLYEAVLSNTPDLAYIFDLEHRFIYANQGLLTMWGKTWEEARGKNCLELGYEPWHAAMHDREIEEVVATRKPIRGEVPFTGTFGTRHYDYIFTPVFGADGTVVAVAGTTRDVTEYRQQQESLRASEARLRELTEKQEQLEAELRQSNRRKDEFLATLAHELRNPLAPVRNAVEVLRLKGPDQPELRWARDVIDRQVSHLTRLIDDLMEVSRITRNRLELRAQRVSLADVVNGAVESSRPLIDEGGHALTVTLPPEPVFVKGDLVRLAQVFMNLLTNAAKYTPRGGRIALRAEHRGSEVVVRVSDTGVGIPPAQLPRLFELFYQVDESIERAQGGLGIGLSLVRRLVELHGGQIEAHSAGPGQGSEFVVRLPALAQPERAMPVVAAATSASQAPSRRVLVVDDNRDSAMTLALVLKLTGNEVETAHDGLEAVSAAERFRPDVVLLDIGMPKLNGLEACQRIRAEPWGRRMKVVALTGWGQEQDKLRTERSGFDAHLVKPVSPGDLRDLLGGP